MQGICICDVANGGLGWVGLLPWSGKGLYDCKRGFGSGDMLVSKHPSMCFVRAPLTFLWTVELVDMSRGRIVKAAGIVKPASQVGTGMKGS